ncbi:glucan endo-1,3-beta-glucosidase 14-like [Olea europaea var. sylvestris]|uniref:glucan endo-1,3-beta-D-glucosidase n=2 Tax=Olea europaea subsp. europaea TaxID=158383 RepID=A0A8S0UB83_OLEEU|nr:glucan endo-1,3-beta-glucosidase 14-like [Olea europaea var. sylvestris]CAA3015862.1 glucan endo-1,3-beta-glucosidase 14-like [Olea europaea subsp. europaea]
METLQNRISTLYVLLRLFLTLSVFSFQREVESLGINYGQIGNNLPPPDKVLHLLQSLNLTKARIYDTNPQILKTFANSNIEIIVTVENEMLSTLMDPQAALQWVSVRIKPYFPATRITGIAVGNEVFTGDDTVLMAYLVQAMVSIHAALVRLGLDQYIQVSTPNSLAVLSESYPPSAGCFRQDLNGIVPELLQFLATTKVPFWINVYPYFAYKNDPDGVSLDYVLFNPNSGMIDPYTNLQYDNMLYAQVDAVIFALGKMGFGGLEVGVSETGWPSKGDPDESGATVENAAIYNRNLLKRQVKNEGTPLRPKRRLEIYVFALFNEDMKPGQTSERNYGLFQPDGTMAYNVGFDTLSTTSNPSASISLDSSGIQVKQRGYMKSFHCSVCSILLYLLAFQLFMTRAVLSNL